MNKTNTTPSYLSKSPLTGALLIKSRSIPGFLQQTPEQTGIQGASTPGWYCHLEPARQYLAWPFPCLHSVGPWHPSY